MAERTPPRKVALSTGAAAGIGQACVRRAAWTPSSTMRTSRREAWLKTPPSKRRKLSSRRTSSEFSEYAKSCCPRCERGGGYIINISSLAGLVGLPFMGLYCASKFALEGVSESLRLEVRPFGVHVVLVEPGDFQSEINATRRIFTSKESAYQTAFEKLLQRRARDETSAPTPEAVAQLIERILNCSQPKTRYAIGMLPTHPRLGQAPSATAHV